MAIRRVDYLAGLLWLGRSFAAKFAILMAIFLAVPILLYGEFRAADAEKNALIGRSVQKEGRLIARSLQPLLETFQGGTAHQLLEAIDRLGQGSTNVKLLFRPQNVADPESFFYVASAPRVTNAYLEEERQKLLHAGLLTKLAESCEGEYPLAHRYTNPAGREELLTSITPVNIAAGCWAIITSHATADLLGSSLGQPYWQTAEVRIAVAVYVMMALVVVSIFGGIWRNLYRFEILARRIRTAGSANISFSALNRIPELDRVAREFDQLVESLHEAARRIREAAEENAHALKAPLGVIAQSLEPLKASERGDDPRRRRAIDFIERSVDRLDALISAARRMDVAAAAAITPSLRDIDLSRFVERMAAAYAETPNAGSIRIAAFVEPLVHAWADDDLLESLLENVIDNAVSFSPPGATVEVHVRAEGEWASVRVEDSGPGVAPAELDRIFERYVSIREPRGPDRLAGALLPGGNFGIGLWVVRRNAEAMGGKVEAENRGMGGFRFILRLQRKR